MILCFELLKLSGEDFTLTQVFDRFRETYILFDERWRLGAGEHPSSKTHLFQILIYILNLQGGMITSRIAPLGMIMDIPS